MDNTNILYQKCFEFLKKEEVKTEIKLFMKPFIDLIIQELYVIISFFLILGIFVLLWRNKVILNRNII